MYNVYIYIYVCNIICRTKARCKGLMPWRRWVHIVNECIQVEMKGNKDACAWRRQKEICILYRKKKSRLRASGTDMGFWTGRRVFLSLLLLLSLLFVFSDDDTLDCFFFWAFLGIAPAIIIIYPARLRRGVDFSAWRREIIFTPLSKHCTRYN